MRNYSDLKHTYSGTKVVRSLYSRSLLIAFFVALMLFATGSAFGSTPQLSINPSSLSWNSVAVGQPAWQGVNLSSTGDSPVTVNSAAISGQGFSVSGANFPLTLNPGQSVTLTVQFLPTTAGTVNGQLAISSNSSNPISVVSLSGTAAGAANTASLSLSTTSLSWNNVAVGSPASQAVSLSSTGTAPVTVNSAAISGQGFSISGANFPMTLNPGQSAMLTVQFLPTTAGTINGQLAISSNSSSNPTAVVKLSGTATGATTTAALSVNPASLSWNSVNVGSPAWQGVNLTSTGTTPVTVNSAAISGEAFSVSGANFPLTLNPGQSVTLTVQFLPTAAGTVSGQLAISSNSSNPNAIVSLSGTGAGNATPTLSTFNCSSSSMSASGSVTCTPTLSAAAPSGGVNVSIASSSATVTVPASVTIPAGATSAPFAANVSSFTTAQTVTLTASAGGVSKTSALQLTPATPTLSINATNIAFGNVTVNSQATQVVTLTSSGASAVTVNAAAVTGTGFTVTGSSFPVTLNPGQTLNLNVQFAPTTVGNATGQLSVTSNSSTNPSAVVALSGAGQTQAQAYQVDLNWNAPADQSDPVVAYNIYRTPSGTASYAQVNSSQNAPTTFTDSTVSSGQSYDYIVKSVDAAGTESAPSDSTTVAVP